MLCKILHFRLIGIFAVFLANYFRNHRGWYLEVEQVGRWVSAGELSRTPPHKLRGSPRGQVGLVMPSKVPGNVRAHPPKYERRSFVEKNERVNRFNVMFVQMSFNVRNWKSMNT